MKNATWLGAVLAIAIGATAAGAQGAGSAKQPAPAKAPKGKGKGKTPEVSREDVARLAGADVEAAAKAAEALGASDAPGAHEALLDALALGLPPVVAVPALGALVLHPAPIDVAAIVRYAGHHNPAVRSAALAALAAYPDPVAQRAVVAGLHDPVGLVRSAAASAAGRGRIRTAVEPMLALLARGEESSARGLAALADPDLARTIADQLGKVPDAALALALGAILKRGDFGPEEARVEVVRALGKIQDPAALRALTDYLDATTKAGKTTSRQEAQMMVDARLGGK